MADNTKRVQLRPQTVEAFDAYIREAEAAMEQSLHGDAPFLWSDLSPERAQRVREGQVVAQFWAGRGPAKVPNGLIHDWIGAVLIPGTTVNATLALIQDYDNHRNVYKPEVTDSRLVSHRDGDFQIYLRLLKKKILTVVLDTDHDVHYRSVDRSRWVCRSYTTRRSGEHRKSKRESAAARHRVRIPMAAVFLLALPRT